MQRNSPGVLLNDAQRVLADRGLKALIPLQGHAFVDYVLSAVADAGIADICVVVGPGAHPVRQHYEGAATTRVRIHLAVQEEPLGAAHALLAAEEFAAGDPVLVINADNYYPAAALAALHDGAGSALAGFRRDVLVARGNITGERVAAYAVAMTDTAGWLTDLIEKPGIAELERLEQRGDSWISMTCWRFRAPIFDACRAIQPSARGELELPDAVMYAVRHLGEPFRVVPVDEPVLDLTARGDIEAVARLLRGRTVLL